LSKSAKPPKPPCTAKQGQYLGFIRKFTNACGYPPAESEIQMHFGVSGPSVHQIVRLTQLGLIARVPFASRSIRVLLTATRCPPPWAHKPRSIRVLLPPELLPQLEL
jgi:hypothetical protein